DVVHLRLHLVAGEPVPRLTDLGRRVQDRLARRVDRAVRAEREPVIDVRVLAAPEQFAVAIELRETRAFRKGPIVMKRDQQAAVVQQLRADPLEARRIGLADEMFGSALPQLVEIGFPMVNDLAIAIDDPGETAEAWTLVEEFVRTAGHQD